MLLVSLPFPSTQKPFSFTRYAESKPQIFCAELSQIRKQLVLPLLLAKRDTGGDLLGDRPFLFERFLYIVCRIIADIFKICGVFQ